MKGLDKKARQQLEELLNRPDLRERDATTFASMKAWYDSDMKFFTSRQRKFIAEAWEKYRNPQGMNKDDSRFASAIENLLARDIPNSDDQTFLRSVLATARGFGGFTANQRKVLRDKFDRYANYERQRQLFEDLKTRYNAKDLPETATSFCESVLSWFADRRFWTDIQQEHVEKILLGRDPEDFEIDTE